MSPPLSFSFRRPRSRDATEAAGPGLPRERPGESLFWSYYLLLARVIAPTPVATRVRRDGATELADRRSFQTRL